MTKSRLRARLCAPLALASLLAAAEAHADPSAADKAAAEALFDEGKKLAQDGQLGEACRRFEASQRLDAGLGTTLYLADCYEKTNRTASAWATFREAAAMAKAANQQEREGIARARAAALEPKLFRLTLTVDPADDLPGFEVRRSGTIVKKEIWGAAVPLDPGRYLVEASAPGKKTWSMTVDVPASPGGQSVAVPVLAAESAAAAAVAPATPPAAVPAARPLAPATEAPRGGGTQRVVGLVLGGVGVAGLAVSGIFTANALSKNSDASKHCDGTKCADAEGATLSTQARDAGNVATIAFAAGAVVLAAGVIVYLTSPSSSPSKAAAHLVGPGRSGPLSLGGTW